MNHGGRILLVEDESGLVMTVGDRLLAAGYKLDTAPSGEKALTHFASGVAVPDLVILDIMLPGIDGFEVCRLIRHKGYGCPILMLTAKGAVNDRVKGLKTGADDYLCKPFAMQELVARVEALLRRLPPGTAASAATPAGEGQAGGGQAASPAPSPRPAPSPVPGAGLRIGAFFFDQAGRCLRPVAGGPATDLSTTEFRLLAVLASNAGRVMSREELLDSAWGYNNETTSRTVDVHIAWLRTKLGEGDKPRHIVTVRRGGYKLVL